jgi:hypothetical protein
MRTFLGCLALALAATLLPSAPALAGRLIVTGHDADLHCAFAGPQCHYVEVAVRYVRGGAPNPALPVLVLDNGALQMPQALDDAFGAGSVPRVVIDPRSPEFASAPIDTGRYSAILIASDQTCGGCDLNFPITGGSETPDSDAINARAADIGAFFNAGGGIFAASGAAHGDGDAATGPDTYYSFLPLPLGGAPVSAPFTLTDAGRAIGLEDSLNGVGTHDDINCCATHNSFTNPDPGSALQVAEFDSQGKAETLFAEGVVSGGQIRPPGPIRLSDIPPPKLGETVNVAVVRGRVLIAVPAGSAAASGGHAVPSQKGLTFAPLTEARQVPVGSFLDTERGTVRLVSATGSGSRTQSGQFNAGLFQVLQSRKRSAKGLTELRLKGSSFNRCRARGGAATDGASAAQLSRRTIRRLRSNARGRFRTRGRHSAATVRGTVWITADRCDGTLTTVNRGKVAVRDLRRKRTITLRAGKSYLARAPR